MGVSARGSSPAFVMVQKAIALSGKPVANRVDSTPGGDKPLPYEGFGGLNNPQPQSTSPTLQASTLDKGHFPP